MSIQDPTGSECALLRAAPESGAAKPDIFRIGARITGIDRAIIARYFEAGGPLSGLTRPVKSPQLRRRWVVGGRLPATAPTAALPRQLETKLSTLATGHGRVLVGCDVLCIEAETLRIVDFMHNVHNAGPGANAETAHLLVDCAGSRASADSSRMR